MTRPTIGERMTAWALLQAEVDGVPEDERRGYAVALLGTFKAAVVRVQFAADDVAATGVFGECVVRLLLGWHPEAARERAAMLTEVGLA